VSYDPDERIELTDAGRAHVTGGMKHECVIAVDRYPTCSSNRVWRWVYFREQTGVWRSPSVAGFQIYRVMVQIRPLRDRRWDGERGIERLRRRAK
jgi:hypothetical protein